MLYQLWQFYRTRDSQLVPNSVNLYFMFIIPMVIFMHFGSFWAILIFEDFWPLSGRFLNILSEILDILGRIFWEFWAVFLVILGRISSHFGPYFFIVLGQILDHFGPYFWLF